MFKNKFFIFIILVFALLSINVVSAQDSSISNIMDSDIGLNESNTEEIITSGYGDNIGSEDEINLQLQSNNNYDEIKVV